ncbi:MAG: shikimate kinase [Bacteroidota bacterium]
MSAIFIVGFMTAGKTREGKRLAKLINRKFIDLDRRIEETENQTETEIFNTKGEEYFRKAESKTLRSLNLNENLIVSCGGGTPCYHDNMLWMLQHGTVVWLKISAVTVLERIAASKKERPLLKNLEGEELQSFITEKLKQREPFYSLAQIQVDTETISIEKLAKEINGRISAE